MRIPKTERPGEILPWQPEVTISGAELIVYHADRLTNEIKDALQDGKVTIWEGLKIGFSIIGAVVAAVKGREK